MALFYLLQFGVFTTAFLGIIMYTKYHYKAFKFKFILAILATIQFIFLALNSENLR